MKAILFLALITLCVGCDTNSVNQDFQPQSNLVESETSSDTLSNSFYVEAEFLTIGTDFAIYNSDGSSVGEIEERTLSFGKKFEYYNSEDSLIATAKERILTYYTCIDIYDGNGKIIGYVKEEIFGSLFSMSKSRYSIRDASNRVIATSDKRDFFTTRVYIYGDKGNVDISQESFTISDTWDVECVGDIDKRLIIFIPSFIASSQSEKSEDE